MNELEYTIRVWQGESYSVHYPGGWRFEISAGDETPFVSSSTRTPYATQRGARQAANNHARKHHYRVQKRDEGTKR